MLKSTFEAGCLIAFLALGCGGGEAVAQREDVGSARALEQAFQKVARDVLPSVVEVLVAYSPGSADPESKTSDDALRDYRHFFTPRGTPRNQAQGSGFMIDENGAIVTNAHVVEVGQSYSVRLPDDTVVKAELLGIDRHVDLAVLRIPSKYARPLRWGDSSRLKPGSIVFALGSPFGLMNSMTQGVVSALGRSSPTGRKHGFIQTDAAINSGNSGGPLVNLDGEVVGINTWIISPVISGGVGFAIPSALGREVVTRLLKGKEKSSHQQTESDAWLGIIPNQDDRGEDGVGVFHVFPGSPAGAAGLRPGDRLISVNGKQLGSVAMFKAMIGNLGSGDQVEVEVDGRGKLNLELEVRPTAYDPRWFQKPEHRLPTNAKLSHRQTELLEQALRGRDCPCPCGRTLANCFGCSAAKSDFTEAEKLILDGLSPAEVKQRLDPPVMLLVWVDYTDPAGRNLLRDLDLINSEFGSMVRVRRRYFPVDPQDLGEWRRAICALEMSRPLGKYEIAHQFLVRDDGLSWEKKMNRFSQETGVTVEAVEQALSEQRYEAQIRKDLTAGPTQYGVTGSPYLMINGSVLPAGHSFPAIRAGVVEVLLLASL